MLSRGFALLAAGSSAGALASVGVTGIAQAAKAADAAALLPVVGTEMLGAFVYQQVLDSGVFPPHVQKVTEDILNQEQMHITTLSAELVRLGGTPPEPFSRVSDADKVLVAHRFPGGLGPLRNEHDCIILLARIEWMLEGAHLEAISKLQSQRLLKLCSQVVANEAQHGTVLSELLHPGDVDKAVPAPFVRGTH
jgi:Ferritin-like domain